MQKIIENNAIDGVNSNLYAMNVSCVAECIRCHKLIYSAPWSLSLSLFDCMSLCRIFLLSTMSHFGNFYSSFPFCFSANEFHSYICSCIVSCAVHMCVYFCVCASAFRIFLAMLCTWHTTISAKTIFSVLRIGLSRKCVGYFFLLLLSIWNLEVAKCCIPTCLNACPTCVML